MTLKGIIEAINDLLKDDRERLKIEGKGLFKLEEGAFENEDTIDMSISITFNGYPVVSLRHRMPVEEGEEGKENIRYMMVKCFLKVLKYGAGSLDYNLYLNDSYRGIDTDN